MKLLNLTSATVSKSTENKIYSFVYENRNELSNELKMFYNDVAGFISLQLSKHSSKRMTMSQILERSYDIETYVLASGAAELHVIYQK